MIAFSAACGALVVSVLIFILRPLRVTSRGAEMVTPVDANLAVYRRQLAELEADRHAGRVADDQFLIERDALERRVIADLAEGSQSNRKAKPTVQPGLFRYVLVIGLPLVAALLYLAIGAANAILQSP
jgi:cytochrome c-type biogenesis protein CcmH